MTAFVDIDELQSSTRQTPKLTVCLTGKPHPRFFLDESAYFQAVLSVLELDQVNRYELTHIRALVFYSARCLGVAEKKITDLLFTELGIARIDHVQRKYYNQVIDFLRDFDQCGRLIREQTG